jgi:hypothetical protein
MKRRAELKLPRHSLSEGMALISLLVLAALALFGPSGLLSWSENKRLLDVRLQEVKALAQRGMNSGFGWGCSTRGILTQIWRANCCARISMSSILMKW